MLADEMERAGTGRRSRGRVPWAVVLLALVALTSSSLSALSLYHVLALQAEVEGLRSEVSRRREERWGAPADMQQQQSLMGNGWTQESQTEDTTSKPVTNRPKKHDKRSNMEGQAVLQACLQILPDSKRAAFHKEFALTMHTGIPWQMGLRRGTALELSGDAIQVNEEGFFFIYSQVCYTDKRYTMGHIIVRLKKNVVGNERPHVTLFRCIQFMNDTLPYSTCYTGGIVKLEVGDKVELLIPRESANISLDGDFTFLGAIKLL